MDEELHICATCGVLHGPLVKAPAECRICTDDRQFVPKTGQKWTNHGNMKQGGSMHNYWQKLEEGLYGVATTPKFAIGQRAFLVKSPHRMPRPKFAIGQRTFLVKSPQGNLLWDCISLLDDATIDILKALGGLRAIAISHPHFYATNALWSAAFNGIPVYIHEKDREWVTFEHENIKFWSGETLPLWDGLTVIKLGGHFAGASVLHWSSGANGRGAILSGDILQVAMNQKSVSIMRSFPNYIPLSAFKAKRISEKMDKVVYDRLYGAFFGLDIEDDAMNIVKSSLDRYAKWVENNDMEV